jgi:hypothetical protein
MEVSAACKRVQGDVAAIWLYLERDRDWQAARESSELQSKSQQELQLGLRV